MAIDTAAPDPTSNTPTVVAPTPRRFKRLIPKLGRPLRRDSAPPTFDLRDSSPARPITPRAPAPTPLSLTPVNIALPRLDTTRIESPGAATPTAAESEHVIGVPVVRAIQGYFKRLLAVLREDGEFEPLRPWLLRAPMCEYSPEMPAYLRPMVLRLLEELTDEGVRESEAYTEVVGWEGGAERLVLSEVPCLIASTAMPGLTKVSYRESTHELTTGAARPAC
jgi:hypothetical protein